MKKYIYIIAGALILSWFAYRFIAIAIENGRYIYNPVRVYAENGTPVRVYELERKTDILKTPLYILDNTGLVSGARIDLFKTGEKIGNGKIVSVNKNIDLDTGMHIVKTSGVTDGLGYAEKEITGFFIPVNAVHDGYVWVAEDNIAVKKEINVIKKDADFAIVSGDVSDGDLIILSDVSDGIKVQIKK